MTDDLPHLNEAAFQLPNTARLQPPIASHRPRILLLYGSLRERSYSRLLTFEAQRLLDKLGAETRIYHAHAHARAHAHDLLLPDDAPADHPKVVELREAML